jgi:hypothetical protein
MRSDIYRYRFSVFIPPHGIGRTRADNSDRQLGRNRVPGLVRPLDDTRAMPNALWRLLLLPLVVLALLLVGTPDFPAFQRAVEKAFTHLAKDAPVTPTRVVALRPETPPRVKTTEVSAAPTPRGVLLPLYASFAALQALDAHSTLRALDAGATEANPLMGGVAQKPAALLAIKAGLTASTIYLVEKVRLKSRGAAIALMAALNSLYATIVAHNYRHVP